MQPYENDIGGWEVPELIEQQASLTRLALDRIYEILCLRHKNGACYCLRRRKTRCFKRIRQGDSC
jgi:hypothetical protein